MAVTWSLLAAAQLASVAHARRLERRARAAEADDLAR